MPDPLERLQRFVTRAPAALALRGPDGRLVGLNPTAVTLVALAEATCNQGASKGFWPPGLEAGAASLDEVSLLQPDGSCRDYLVQAFPVEDAADPCLGAIALDITARKEAERSELRHRTRESLCLLAGGISHDFNNLLGAMIGHVELARMEVGDTDPVLARLQAIEDLITRASGLVEQILAYAGRGRYQAQTLDLNRQVEEVARVLRSSLGGRTCLDWEPAPALPPMEGRLAQIQQLIVNLVVNAAEAVNPVNGLIAIRTASRTLGLADLHRDFPGQALQPGPHVILEVADNGQGMRADLKDRIFEPFFTTKSGGRGLGLSAVQGIVRSHGGGIQVVSQKDRGTTFRLAFPAAAGAVPALPGAAPGEAFRGTGTVLVVDDEQALREVAVEALQGMGFETLEAANGLEALQAFHAHPEGIRLVVMNLTMPRMDGEQAFHELRRAGLKAPVILSSGFDEEEALRRFQGRGLAGFLQRPYRYPSLVAVVRAALEPST